MPSGLIRKALAEAIDHYIAEAERYSGFTAVIEEDEREKVMVYLTEIKYIPEHVIDLDVTGNHRIRVEFSIPILSKPELPGYEFKERRAVKEKQEIDMSDLIGLGEFAHKLPPKVKKVDKKTINRSW